jgi:hypothetical protein
MKLSNLVDIAVNNEECVVLKVKENVMMDLIALGCFDGDETMFRITKGEQHTATLFRGNHHFSWGWGNKGYTSVSDKQAKCGHLIQACVEEEFGIYIGKDSYKIKKTLHIKAKADKMDMKYHLKILYWAGQEKERCNIHKDGEHFKWFANVEIARTYIHEHYNVISDKLYNAVTGCKVEEYQAVSK